MHPVICALGERDGYKFVMHGQPILPIDSEPGSPPAWYELLLRLRHYGRLQRPIEFLPDETEKMMLAAIDWWVLEFVNGCLRQYPELNFSINFSRHLLADPLLHLRLNTLFKGVDTKRRLTLEVSERYFWSLPEHEELIRLHSIAKLSLDDVGENRLNELVRLPINGFKVDGILTRQVLIDVRAAAIVQSLIALAWELDWIVVVEYVESVLILEWLRKQSDHYAGVKLFAQGHAMGDYRQFS